MQRFGRASSRSRFQLFQCQSDANLTSCWIMTFDSLGGSHRGVSGCLSRWLQHEARDKKNVTYDMSDAHYMEARVSETVKVVNGELCSHSIGSPTTQFF